jgi:hypothetical protein
MVQFLPLNVPQTCPNTSEANIIAVGPTVWLAYYVGPLDPAHPAYGLVRFDVCMNLLSGSPNDDARHNHPLKPPHYGAFEVVGSPWIKERGEVAHRERRFDSSNSQLRHFIFCFKEDTFECLARSMTSLGTFPDGRAAMDAAFREMQATHGMRLNI